MNERVWLQSKVTFVNTKLAISLGFLATFLTFSCSPTENSEEKAPIQQETEVSIAKETLPSLPIVWESKPAAAPIVDLAIGKSASGSFYITAILEDGSAESFDLDGIPIARSKPGLFKEIAAGAPIAVADTNLLAHVTKSNDGFLSLALVSPENQLTGFAVLPMAGDSEEFEILCAGLSEHADTEIHGGYIRDQNYFDFTVGISTDSPSYEERSGMLNEEIKTFCTSSSALFNHYADDIDTFTWLDAKAGNLIKVSNADEKHEITFSLKEGMSVSAPLQINSIAAYSGFVSVDYPKGLITIAGDHSDGTSKISFVSAESVLSLFEETHLEKEETGLTPEIQNLQKALKEASKEN